MSYNSQSMQSHRKWNRGRDKRVRASHDRAMEALERENDLRMRNDLATGKQTGGFGIEEQGMRNKGNMDVQGLSNQGQMDIAAMKGLTTPAFTPSQMANLRKSAYGEAMNQWETTTGMGKAPKDPKTGEPVSQKQFIDGQMKTIMGTYMGGGQGGPQGGGGPVGGGSDADIVRGMVDSMRQTTGPGGVRAWTNKPQGGSAFDGMQQNFNPQQTETQPGSRPTPSSAGLEKLRDNPVKKKNEFGGLSLQPLGNSLYDMGRGVKKLIGDGVKLKKQRLLDVYNSFK